jgi:hypothetical protein
MARRHASLREQPAFLAISSNAAISSNETQNETGRPERITAV